MNSIGRAWDIRACVRARDIAVLIAVVGALALWGCGDDDDNPMEPEPNEPARSTPSELLSIFFETAYTEQDSTLYPHMLDEAFTFQFLPWDADSLRDVLGEDDFWGKTPDVASTMMLFGTPNVTGITLNILVNNEDADTSCVGCRRVESTVTLRIETIGDGTEPLVFTVDSPQTFVVKPDPSDSTKWVILRQIDRPSSLKAEPQSVESSSWGNIKGLFGGPGKQAVHLDEDPVTAETSWGRIKGVFR
jgi:hypothetical protein